MTIHRINQIAWIPGILALLLLVGSCSSQTRYRVLSFLFDGVPEPGKSVEAVDTPVDTGQQDLDTADRSDPTPLPVVQPGSRHLPWAEDACDACHSGFELVTGGKDLCYMCHDASSHEGRVVHGALEMEACTACHNPHQSEHPSLLRHTGAEMCEPCHGRDQVDGSNVHMPAAAGECLMCHLPHAGENPGLLTAIVPEICSSCHGIGSEEVEYPHPPVMSGDCGMCHETHVSEVPGGHLLTASPLELCFYCHDGSWQELAVQHMPATMGECGSCHDVHGSSQGHLLKGPVTEVCATCHTGSSEHIGEVVEMGMACMDCHFPHASANEKLIR